MLIIAHRGNTNGPNKYYENLPSHVHALIEKGVDVEVDVHSVYGNLYLGHDTPVYEIPQSFLRREHLWCHAKNHAALDRLISIGAHCFAHDGDDYAITSRGYIWCHPRMATQIVPAAQARSIIVMPDKDADIRHFFGVCTDDISRYA